MLMLWKCFGLLLLIDIVTAQYYDGIHYSSYQAETERSYVRPARFAQPNGIIGFFQTLGNIKRLFDDQYTDTANALQRIYNLVSDGFSDTATTRKPPLRQSTTVAPLNAIQPSTTTTTKEPYRISRNELGYILGKNYRGLQKLLRLELADAATQSQQNIRDYRREFGNALIPHAMVAKSSITSSKAKR